MKVRNMISSLSGKAVANQFIIQGCFNDNDNEGLFEYFQSYGTVIAKRTIQGIQLDRNSWDYSVTTGRYRNQFLGETKAKTQKKIDSGEYELVDLN